MDWTVLGIEPTTDKKAITLAYRNLLKQTNPEDKPEEFKALREAYEQALAWAAEQEAVAAAAEASANETPKTPVEQWSADLAALYDDFPRRISVEAWQKLLSQDVAIALDTRPQVETELLIFLLRNVCIPQDVWQLLGSTFDWASRRDELYEAFPRGFVDHILMDGANYTSALPYHLFSPGLNGADCDAYLDLYLQARRCEWEEVPDLLAKMEALSESHPYGTALTYHALATAGDGLGVVKMLELIAEYPDDLRLKGELAEMYLEGEAWEQCEKLARQLHEADRTDRRYIWMMAQSLAGLERYAEGVELLGDLMHAAGGDQKELMELSDVRKTWNEKLIEQYEARVEQGECDDRLLFELSWCYLQNERNEESVELLGRMGREGLEDYEYYNLSSQAYLSTERYEEAFEDSKALVEVVRAMQPDGTEKTDKRIARLAEMIARCGDALYAQKRIKEALPYYEEAAEVSPDNPERLTHYSRVMASLNRWPEAAAAAERLVEIVPGAYHAQYLLAQYYFEMHNDRDAFYRVNIALDLERGDLGVYVLRLRILIRNGALEEAASDLRFLDESGCSDYLPVLWAKALYAEAADLENIPLDEDGVEMLPDEGELSDGTPYHLPHGRAAAHDLYQEVYNRLLEGEEMDWAGQVCYRLALLTQNDNGESDEQQLEILNKGLELDPHDESCLDFKAWLLRRMERTDEAIEAYEQLHELPHAGVEAERALARLYAKDSDRNAHKALKFYQLVLEAEPNDPVSLYYAGLYAYYVRDFALAEGYFLREKAVEPDCVDSYRLLCFVYEAWGRYEDALCEADELIRVAKAADELKLAHYLRKVHILRRMGRYEDAVEASFKASFAFPYEDVYADVAEIYLQGGLYEQNAGHLSSWENTGKKFGSTMRDPGGLAYAQMMQEVLTGNERRAKHFARTGRTLMSQSQRDDADRLLASLVGDYKAEAKCVLKAMAARKAEGGNIVGDLEHLAAIYWFAGDLEQARSYAEQALEGIEAELLPFTTTRPLYLTKRSAMLGLLGRYDEAEADLAEARVLPLCEQCVYGACKDADYFEAQMELFRGNMQASLEKTLAGLKRWPDETDFVVLLNELKRRGVE